MYQNYKIVVNTAAGRRRYMQYLIPYIVASPVVDRYDIWINTHNGADIEFFRQIAEAFPKVSLVWQPEGVVAGNASINAFYRACTEPDTIYFKLDDDIVWMEPGLIENMVRFRIENPEYFIVSPLVINNSLSTYLLQIMGKLPLDRYYNADSSHPVLWRSGHFATHLHRWFIENYLKTGRWSELHVGTHPMGMTRFSINAILWFGDEMRRFAGEVPGDDEEFMSCIYPTRQGRANAWNGDTIAAHFAFFTQREQLDRAGILERYGQECRRLWAADPMMAPIDENVRRIMDDIAARESELTAAPSPYRSIPPRKVRFQTIKRLLPASILEYMRQRRDNSRKDGFIR